MAAESSFKRFKHKVWLQLEKLPGFPVFAAYWFGIKGHYKIRKFRTISREELLRLCGGKIHLIEPETERKVFQAEYFEEKKGEEFTFTSPEIYLLELSNACAVGASGIVTYKNKAYYEPLTADKEGRCDFEFGPLKLLWKSCIYVGTGKNDRKKRKYRNLDQVIDLCGFAPWNYYHFTMEILSRLGYVDSIPEFRELPLLIDAGTLEFPQLTELLEAARGNHPVIYVEEGEIVPARHMVVPSMNTWMPINVRSEELFRISDNMIAKSGIRFIREISEPYREKRTSGRIFLARGKDHYSRLINEEEAAEVFKKNGFEIVYPDTLSWKQQVELFSSSDIIVGTTGAALTNWIYCSEGAVLGCFVAEEFHFCIYSTIGEMVGGKCLFYSPHEIEYHGYSSQDRYHININRLEGYIQALIRLYEEDKNRKVWCHD